MKLVELLLLKSGFLFLHKKEKKRKGEEKNWNLQ
jgi:hypothetical protein